MARVVKRRRGSTADHLGFTGVAGEITVDTTKNTLVVHDGVTAGGYPLAKEGDLPAGAVIGTGITDIVRLFQNQYDDLVLAGDIDDYTLYVITPMVVIIDSGEFTLTGLDMVAF